MRAEEEAGLDKVAVSLNVLILSIKSKFVMIGQLKVEKNRRCRDVSFRRWKKNPENLTAGDFAGGVPEVSRFGFPVPPARVT